jgi:hypothetical protein
MSKKRKILGVILILFIYIVIAILGFFVVYLFKNAGTKNANTTNATTVVKTTPIPVPTGYKTYQNSSQKFSVGYPQDLKVKESGYGFGVNTIEMRSPDNSSSANAPDIQILTVPKTLASTIGQDFDSYYQMADNSTKVIKSPTSGNGDEAFTKVRNREINGLRAVEYASVPSPNPDKDEPEIGVFIETGSDMTIIATGESDRAEMEKMLQTFTYPK